jgi:hypothetical protein
MIGKLTFLICWMVGLGTLLHGADSDAQQRHLMDGAKKANSCFTRLWESAKPGLKPDGYPGHLKFFPSRVQLAEKLEEYSRRYRELFVR